MFPKQELSYPKLVFCCFDFCFSDGSASLMEITLEFNSRLKREASHCKIIYSVFYCQALVYGKLSPELHSALKINVQTKSIEVKPEH